jgi:thiol:disulfide interchange protein DsbG
MNHTLKVVCGYGLLLMAMTGPAQGQTPAATGYEVAADVRTRIEGIVGKTGATVNYFRGPSGTVGVGLTLANGRQMVAYATADGGTLFSGAVIDTATGENVARRDLEARMPKPDFSELGAALKKGHAITTGPTESGTVAADFYVFVDPFCPYCHKAYDNFVQLQREYPSARVHWIPVGILGPKSEQASKGLLGLSSDRRSAALASVMTTSVSAVSPADAAAGDKAHQANLALFRGFQFSAVPVVVTVQGDRVDVTQGLPQLADLRKAFAPTVAKQ